MFTPEKRSEIMSKIRAKDTKIEVSLRKCLWHEGIIGFRLRPKIPGKPDIVFTKYKVAVFCDGDFWHGFKFSEWSNRLSPYWFSKISGNMERDKRNDNLLSELGWLTVHLWEHELEKDMDISILKVKTALKSRGFVEK